MNALVDTDIKPIEFPQSKTDSLRPESMHQALAQQVLHTEIATQTHSVVDQAEK